MVQGKQTVEDEEIIEKMRESPEPAFATSELANEFNMTEDGIRRRLKQLWENGRICRKKPSKKVVLWWVKENQREAVLSK